MPGPQESGSQPEGGRLDGPAGLNHGIFARKAQRIQKIAGLAEQGETAEKGAESLHAAAGAGAEMMPAQQADALEPGPESPQFLFGCQGRRGGLLAVLLLLDFIVDQKSGSPSGGIGSIYL